MSPVNAVILTPTVEKWRKGDRKKPYDPNVDASRQEMRSFVCGQCHVEYYCATKDVLFFPWQKGLKVEQMEAVYDERKFPDGSKFFDYKHAETGAEAVRKYRELHPSLVTMDIIMPDMGGIDAVREIIKEHPDANILMCSAMGQQALVIEAIQAGARDFVVKPFQPSRVLEAVQRVLG